MPSADHGEGIAAGKISCPRNLGHRLFAGIDQIGIFVALKRKRPHAQHAVLALQHDLHPLGNVVRHQRRHADAHLHIEAITQLTSNAFSFVGVLHGCWLLTAGWWRSVFGTWYLVFGISTGMIDEQLFNYPITK